MALITCTGVSFAYDGNTVLSNLNFSLDSGDYLCITGENGSGKTTLIKGLLRLKQPANGRIMFGDGLRTNEIGYLPQQTPLQKDFPADVYEIVLSGRAGRRGWRPFYSAADKAAADEYINQLNICDLKHKCYRELSVGQQKRALLARALCAAGKLLLLDEPAAGLDGAAAQDFYAQLESINRQMGITVIMVSHDIHSALKYADHILCLNKNQVFFGKTQEWGKEC